MTVDARRNVVHEIADRRRADLERELADGAGPATDAGPTPRSFTDAFLAPGLHILAEVKRASPSAGTIAGAGLDIVAQARAYEAGGAAAISVLCEPHWFGGSVDDLRLVRAAVGVPVLAKEFVVDPRQFAVLRAAGADAVLLLVVLHPTRRLLRSPGPGRRRRGAGTVRRGARPPRGRPRRRQRGARHRPQQP